MSYQNGGYKIQLSMFFHRHKLHVRIVAVLGTCLLLLCLPTASLFAQSMSIENVSFSSLAGSKKGLYGISQTGKLVSLWNNGEVKKIVKAPSYWTILSDTGIFVSTDLFHWEARNLGLPVKPIKIYENGEKSFEQMIQELKDVKIHPENSNIMVTATKDAVFLSRDEGRTWRSLGMPPYQTNGLKAVAVGNMPELTVFVSHSIYGIHYIQPENPSSRWQELVFGLEMLETTSNPDEVSDIAIVMEKDAQGETKSKLYAGQTFRHRLYQLDWENKRFDLIWTKNTAFGTVESLDVGSDTIRFVSDGSILEKRIDSDNVWYRSDLSAVITKASASLGIMPECFAFLDQVEPIFLSELWLLNKAAVSTEDPYIETSYGKDGLYLPVNHAMDPSSLKPYLDIIKNRNLNMVVIDMKDDNGRLRFTPYNTELTKKGRVFWPVDIDNFIKTMKDLGVYVVARIVVFKDPELVKKENGKYAIWDARTNQPWAGYYETRREKVEPTEDETENTSVLVQEVRPSEDPRYETVRTYYDEKWVDPYSEEVWEYNSNVAKELIERGFDEIQFDYIRFPTDGINLSNATYRWKDDGMDKESAMVSFLRYARKTIKAPISIDIYGANGWYRTGSRTGQEVEMLAPYVDVICPMYYPSHFEQDFLAQTPPEERPYRIYYQGTKRTEHIARGKVVVRSWIQAFYLNVAYDRKYYNAEYVLREVEGVRDAGNPGFTYWNNSGRYEDIPFLERE
jgi:hypothetical protein